MVSPLLCVHTFLTHDYQALANTIVPTNSFDVHVYTSVCLVSTFEQSSMVLVLGSRLIFNLYEAGICLCGAVLWIFKATISSNSLNDYE
jgi:hypothetical protein